MTELPEPIRTFVLHWGEMGARWGINRTVAQIHALLMISERPLHAEEIAQTLQVARSNVSTSLKELQNWGLIRTRSVLGDRRDHFESEKDVWEMFRIVMEERKRREIDPTIRVLRECVSELERDPDVSEHAEAQVGSLLNFLETTSSWYEQFKTLSPALLSRFFKLGGQLQSIVSRRRAS